MKPTIAITAGDINGVGYEVILKTLADAHVNEVCQPIVYGNAKIAKLHAQTLDEEYHNVQLNIVQCYEDTTPVLFGQSTSEAGAASFAALERATQDLKNGKVDAIVTAPINKENIQSSKFQFSGHTEYLTSIFAAKGQEALMMMVNENMRVALVSNHTPITKVSNVLTKERIMRKLLILNHTLLHDFMIRSPRIAVLALNPHAGDNGLIGEEEQTIIAPAIAEINEQGVQAFGPYSADGFFGGGQFTHFDAILAMYHDQGLIPFKTLDMNGVNYTAGLPIVRTSPDHGTAYDLAGKNMANPQSFAHALWMAIDMLKNRELDAQIHKNPLVIVPKEDKNNHNDK